MKVLGQGVRVSASSLFRYTPGSQMIGNLAMNIADFIDKGGFSMWEAVGP